MDDPLSVGLVERVRDLAAEAEDLVESERTLHEPLGQGLALEVLHDEELDAVLVADVVQRADVGVGKRRDGLRFPLEPLTTLGAGGEVRRQDFYRDRAIEPRVARLVHLAHAARADRGDDLVRAEPGCRRKWSWETAEL